MQIRCSNASIYTRHRTRVGPSHANAFDPRPLFSIHKGRALRQHLMGSPRMQSIVKTFCVWCNVIHFCGSETTSFALQGPALPVTIPRTWTCSFGLNMSEEIMAGYTPAASARSPKKLYSSALRRGMSSSRPAKNTSASTIRHAAVQGLRLLDHCRNSAIDTADVTSIEY